MTNTAEKRQVDARVLIPRLKAEDGCEERRRSRTICEFLLLETSPGCGQTAGPAGTTRWWELQNEPRSKSNTRGWKAWNRQCVRGLPGQCSWSWSAGYTTKTEQQRTCLCATCIPM